MPQLRQNIITGDWVIIAPERSKRPSEFVVADSIKHESKIDCNFCVPEGAAYKDRLKGQGLETDNVYVITNKYPAFLEDSGKISARAYKIENDFYRVKPSLGGHEVVIVKDHDLSIFTFPTATWFDLIKTLKLRYQHFRHVVQSEYSMAIYNQGVNAGASIAHPHAQLFVSNITPNQINKELYGGERYFQKNGSCVFCDLVIHEKKEKHRVLYEDAHFLAFTFYAARFPFETHILPKEHYCRFEEIPDSIIHSLVKCLKQTIHQLDQTLKHPPLNFYIHSMPNSIEKAAYYHWHLEIVPRVSNYGGFELGSGVIIDVVSPEEAAKFLRREKN